MEVVRDGSAGGEDQLVLSGGAFVGTRAEPTFWGVSSTKGKVANFDVGDLEGIPISTVSTRGCPTGVAVDEAGRVYVSDVEHGAILRLETVTGRFVPIVQDYEGKPLLGPSSIAFSGDGTMYFTDSGPFGESSLEDPCGSVFSITKDENGQILKPLASGILAHPCGICVSPLNDGVIYVAETLKNRILRFKKRPHGAYVTSVLHQFSGALGPSAIACDSTTGHLYVARFDFDGSKGLVSVIDPMGTGGGHVRDFEIPGGSEITGVCIQEETRQLLVFESTTGNVISLPL
mmetsp:Transcript_7481/g.12007  ORF Transcript_7481/g.12007 Transcript_7481/m.12007 type:complete len:289 (-) Transcript_7481:2394-3260(-)